MKRKDETELAIFSAVSFFGDSALILLESQGFEYNLYQLYKLMVDLQRYFNQK